MDKFITLNDIRFHYLDSGGNKPVFLWLHDLFGTAYSLSGLLEAGLDNYVRVLALTMRGRGQSDKPESGYTMIDYGNDVIAFMDALGLETVMLAGHDFGGKLAAYVAYHFPDRVEKLVLVDAAVYDNPQEEELHAPLYGLVDSYNPFFKYYLNRAQLSPNLNGFWTPALEKHFAAMVRSAPDGMVHVWADREILEETAVDVKNQPWPDMFRQIEAKTLLLNGPQPFGGPDVPPMLPKEEALSSADLLPRGHYQMIPGNHLTMLYGEGAEMVVETIANFGGYAKGSSIDDAPFRFFDNREKYLLFVTTTSEKAVIAERVGQEFERINPRPPALKIFDAGMGNGTVLSRLLREMHCRFPTVPVLVVGKEISLEDTRLTLDELPDRLSEHPQMVVVITNLFYAEAPWLEPNNPKKKDKVEWWDIPLKGNTAHDFSRQIADLDEILTRGWQTKPSKVTGNPVYVTPSVMVLYREDHAFALDDIIPKKGRYEGNYDLVIAAQPYRSRMPAEFKIEKILKPLASSLAVNGRMIVIQSTGLDPAMEIIRNVWPDEEPFATPRHLLIKTMKEMLGDELSKYSFDGFNDDRSLFTYHLHSLPDEISNTIGTSTLLAAWNAAVYVAQIEDDRLNSALRTGEYLEATQRVLQRHGGLWFQDESFVVVKIRD